jgi:hypothetical protein
MSRDTVELNNKYSATIVRCPDCPDSVECPLNQLTDKIQKSRQSPNLELLATKVNIKKLDSGSLEDGIGPGGKYVIYQCTENSNERGDIRIKTNRD